MRYYFPALLIFLSLNVSAQDSLTYKYTVFASGNLGFIIAHRPSLLPLQEGHVKGFDIAVSRKTDGTKSWQEQFLYPETGLLLSYFDLGTKKLGRGVAIFPFIDFPLGKNSEVHLRYGMGFGWIEHIFNPVDNYQNAAIGSHFNGVIHVDLHYEKEIGKTVLFGGVGLTHFSSGGFKVPNLGINIALMNAGMKCVFGTTTIRHSNQTTAKPTAETDLYIAGALKNIYPPFGKQYYASTISVSRQMPIRRRSFWGVGVDLFYDNSIAARLDRIQTTPAKESDNIRTGIYGSYCLKVGSLGLMFNMGGYIYNKWKDDGNIYHRICVRYELQKLFFCVNLKTHYARADFVEVGIGYRFKNRHV